MFSLDWFLHKRFPTAVLRVGAMALALSCIPFPVAAQPSLDELEKRIQQGKTKRAQETVGQGKVRSANQAEQARLATIVVQTDAPCEFSVNGKRVRTLAQGVTEVKVPAGRSLVNCDSTEAPGLARESELELHSGQNTVLRIQLASLVDRHSRRLGEMRAACDGVDAHIMESGGAPGVLNQCGTRLEWTKSDNQEGIDWNDALDYCRGKGAGWRLPTTKELRSLYKRESSAWPCGEKRCHVSYKFSLTERWFWSSERDDDSSKAVAVELVTGEGYWYPTVYDELRALCVRRP